jgi:hypothetical protein
MGRARRNSIDSEEDGILREDCIELSYTRSSKRLQPRDISQTSLHASPRMVQAV